MPKKPIMKSIRFSEEIYAAVDSYIGNGFSDKFENFVSHYVWLLPSIDKEISQKQDIIVNLEFEISKKRKILSELDGIQCRVSDLLRFCNSKTYV